MSAIDKTYESLSDEEIRAKLDELRAEAAYLEARVKQLRGLVELAQKNEIVRRLLYIRPHEARRAFWRALSIGVFLLLCASVFLSQRAYFPGFVSISIAGLNLLSAWVFGVDWHRVRKAALGSES
jgi:ribosomal protein L29